jgi:hypothetical protein
MYGTYWARMATAWGDRRLDELLTSDIETMKNTAATTARSRRSSRPRRHVGEHVAAARAIYDRGIADDLIDLAVRSRNASERSSSTRQRARRRHPPLSLSRTGRRPGRAVQHLRRPGPRPSCTPPHPDLEIADLVEDPVEDGD